MATRKRKAIRAAKRAHAEISNTSNTNIEENTNEAAAAVAQVAAEQQAELVEWVPEDPSESIALIRRPVLFFKIL